MVFFFWIMISSSLFFVRHMFRSEKLGIIPLDLKVLNFLIDFVL